MASDKSFLNYVLEQLSPLEDVNARPMMGEYLLYYRGKLVGDVCNNKLFIKPVAAAEKLLPDSLREPPYTGAKPMIVIEDLDDREFLHNLFEAMYEELPMRKPKKKKQ